MLPGPWPASCSNTISFHLSFRMLSNSKNLEHALGDPHQGCLLEVRSSLGPKGIKEKVGDRLSLM